MNTNSLFLAIVAAALPALPAALADQPTAAATQEKEPDSEASLRTVVVEGDSFIARGAGSTVTGTYAETGIKDGRQNPASLSGPMSGANQSAAPVPSRSCAEL